MRKAALVLWTLLCVVVALSVISWGVLHLRRWDASVGFQLPAWSWAPGLVLAVAGGFLVLLCAGILGTRGFWLTPGEQLWPKEFVAFGPFRYVRNPMSLGWVTLMLRLGLYQSSGLMVLFSAALLLLIHVIVVYREEPGLEKRFGESYREYKRSVHR
jgi:protein-S-isoprenylcysteine O-methyltransferase Ste14